MKMEDILGTKKGIEALTDFLQASGAFTKTGLPRGEILAPIYDAGGEEEESEESDGEGAREEEEEEEEEEGEEDSNEGSDQEEE
ncbi:hypothetical protein JAAARDRAFT_34502 [Jaapia argillacea MUCL 33604]|uniref:Uncharacterized protein n=1 Tax=Jaapia argillacea MUCL 33604 TaxID=933084 RepID=A0A067Q5A2_9AGAM|nr:hypothetical protein JAAARDRAFT_34502 [Jaapia argillacea MUCL 33604]